MTHLPPDSIDPPASEADASDGQMPSGEAGFYARQMRLPEIGVQGQQRLRGATVLVIGAGGLGCPALQYLAAAGVGQVRICDGDRVEVSNLHRQVLYDYEEAGRPKAEAAAGRLHRMNPFIQVTHCTDALTTANVDVLLDGVDAALDCTDNFRAKFLLHDACYLKRIPLIQSSIHRFNGQIQVFRPGRASGCMRCLWPEIPEADCVGTCADEGVLGAVPGILGTLQALETISTLLGHSSTCEDHTVLIDLKTLNLRSIQRPRDPACPLCGGMPSITQITEEQYMDQPDLFDWELTVPGDPDELTSRYKLIDIRSHEERLHQPPRRLAMDHLAGPDPKPFLELPADQSYLLVCAGGIRSRLLAQSLRAAGADHFYSLVGGLHVLDAG